MINPFSDGPEGRAPSVQHRLKTRPTRPRRSPFSSTPVRHRQTHPRRRAAFTLLELLVAMFIVAILSLSLYASLQIAFRSKASAEAAVEPPRTAATALDLIGQDLQAAAPLTAFPAQSLEFEGVDQTDSRGHPGDDLQFYTVADSPLHANANGDVKGVELTTVPSPDGRDHLLVRKVIRNLLSENFNAATPFTPGVNPDVEVICRGVGGFNLRYYNGDTWADSWDSTQEDNTIPAAVEVTLTLDRTDASGVTRSYNYVRIFPLSASTAAQDSTVNPNADVGLP